MTKSSQAKNFHRNNFDWIYIHSSMIRTLVITTNNFIVEIDTSFL
jgi:hypothetical protein